MPQSATTDVNSAVTLYRNNMRTAMRIENWTDLVNCVDGINGILPDDLKLLFGHEPVIEKRYVRCPACSELVEYSKNTVRQDVRAGLFSGNLAGRHDTEYLACKCGRRVYLSGEFEMLTQSADVYNPETVLPMAPALLPIPNRELFLEWGTMVVAVIEDRCRRWRLQFSTQNEMTTFGGQEPDESGDSGGGAGAPEPAGGMADGAGVVA